MLKEIKKIFEKHNTKYKVIISPLYNQTKLSIQDLATLKSIFQNDLYDYSGVNSFTQNIHNYYEKDHFRTLVGDSIFSIIYK